MLLQGCAPKTPDHTIFYGQLSVDPAIDSVQNYSGFQIRVVSPQDPASAIFTMATDSAGFFSGRVSVEEKGFHPVILSRYGRDLTRLRILFANGDTVRFQARFPIADSTITIQSAQQSAFETYERVERNFNRITAFIQAGVLSGDSARTELLKWSDLYWDLHTQHPDMMASDMAALRSVVMLQGVDDSLMQARYARSLSISDAMIPEGAIHMGFWNDAQGNRKEAVRIFEDALRRAESHRDRRDLYHAYTRLLYQQNQSGEGERLLKRMVRDLSTDSLTLAWRDAWMPEFTTLRQGEPLPDFSWVAEGDTLTLSKFEGGPLLIEFARLSSPYYQQVYDRHLVVAQLFADTGLQFITFADDRTPARLESFFSERLRLWPFVTDAGESVEEVHARYNIQAVPSWVLVDGEGRIHRKFIGREIEGLIPHLQSMLGMSDPADGTSGNMEQATE